MKTNQADGHQDRHHHEVRDPDAAAPLLERGKGASEENHDAAGGVREEEVAANGGRGAGKGAPARQGVEGGLLSKAR